MADPPRHIDDIPICWESVADAMLDNGGWNDWEFVPDDVPGSPPFDPSVLVGAFRRQRRRAIARAMTTPTNAQGGHA